MEALIWQNEVNKIRMITTPAGRQDQPVTNRFQGFTAMQHSSVVDENYLAIGANIEGRYV